MEFALSQKTGPYLMSFMDFRAQSSGWLSPVGKPNSHVAFHEVWKRCARSINKSRRWWIVLFRLLATSKREFSVLNDCGWGCYILRISNCCHIYYRYLNSQLGYLSFNSVCIFITHGSLIFLRIQVNILKRHPPLFLMLKKFPPNPKK